MFITYIILGTTILISIKAFDDSSFKSSWLFNAYDIIQRKKVYKILSHAFIHADFMHLGFNMYVLWMFGVESSSKGGYESNFKSLEPSLIDDFGMQGYWYFFLLYAGGIAFSSLYALNKHKDNPHYNSLGASGAVSAVVFASIILNPNAQMGLLLIPFYIPAYIFGPLMLVGEYFMAKRGGTNIAHDAHISGAIFGIIFITAINPTYIVNFFNSILP